MDAALPGFQWNPPDQQSGRYHQLCNGRVWTANANAHDLDTIANHEIVVRCAGKDEKFVTLDGQERIMDENVLMDSAMVKNQLESQVLWAARTP